MAVMMELETAVLMVVSAVELKAE
jgi:hypothetical protein